MWGWGNRVLRPIGPYYAICVTVGQTILILHTNVDIGTRADKQSSTGTSKVDVRVTKVILAQGDGHWAPASETASEAGAHSFRNSMRCIFNENFHPYIIDLYTARSLTPCLIYRTLCLHAQTTC
jgi:hypothetical protein